MQPCPATAHGITHSRDGFILSDNPFVQFLLEVQQFLLFALHHPCYGDTSPPTHHLSDIIGCNLLTYHAHTVLGRCQLLLYMCDILFESLQLGVANLGHPLVVTLAFSPFRLETQLLHLLLILLDLVHQITFVLPSGTEGALFLAKLGNLLVELPQLTSRTGIISITSFSRYRRAFNLQLRQLTGNVIQFLRHTVAFHTQLGSRLIHQVDGLIRQETV